jgi:hypothetical protein
VGARRPAGSGSDARNPGEDGELPRTRRQVPHWPGGRDFAGGKCEPGCFARQLSPEFLPGIAVALDEHSVARLPAFDDVGRAAVARRGGAVDALVWTRVGLCSCTLCESRPGPSGWGYLRWASRRRSRHRTCCCTAESPFMHGSGSSGTSMLLATASRRGSLTPATACTRPRFETIAVGA